MAEEYTTPILGPVIGGALGGAIGAPTGALIGNVRASNREAQRQAEYLKRKGRILRSLGLDPKTPARKLQYRPGKKHLAFERLEALKKRLDVPPPVRGWPTPARTPRIMRAQIRGGGRGLLAGLVLGAGGGYGLQKLLRD